MHAKLRSAIGPDFCVFTDGGFAMSDVIVTPYSNRNHILTPEETQFNEKMRGYVLL